MTPIHLPSDDVPESQKRRFSESDVHSKLFAPDLAAIGYPPHSATQADVNTKLANGAHVKLQTKGAVELITQRIVAQPGATFGWHSHPGRERQRGRATAR